MPGGLLDTNVLLDYLLCRVPCAQDARDILAACRDGRIKGSMAAHSPPNMFYTLRRTCGIEERRSILLSLCELLDVIDIGIDDLLISLGPSGDRIGHQVVDQPGISLGVALCAPAAAGSCFIVSDCDGVVNRCDGGN